MCGSVLIPRAIWPSSDIGSQSVSSRDFALGPCGGPHSWRRSAFCRFVLAYALLTFPRVIPIDKNIATPSSMSSIVQKPKIMFKKARIAGDAPCDKIGEFFANAAEGDLVVEIRGKRLLDRAADRWRVPPASEPAGHPSP